MNKRLKALDGLLAFLEDAEYGSGLPNYEYKTAEQIYRIVYNDDLVGWGDFLRDQIWDWKDLEDYLPKSLAEDIIIWGAQVA